MNIAQMLNCKVTPLSQYQPSEPQKKTGRSGNPAPDNTIPNAAKQAKAIARYSKAMRGGWAGTAVIEQRLGMGRSCALVTLNKWLKLKIVERRPVGGVFNRNKGFEWRIKK